MNNEKKHIQLGWKHVEEDMIRVSGADKYDIQHISLYVYMKFSIIKKIKTTFQRNSKIGPRETSSFLVSHLALLLYFAFKFFFSQN